MNHYSPTDIFLVDGAVYHLRLRPGQLSPYLLLVGDPGRAELIANEFFSKIEVNTEHRGLRSITGEVTQTGQRVSVVTSGMGTSSLEIVLTEILTLFEVDFETLRRRPAEECPRLCMIRVGTCGALQLDTPVGIPIISLYAVGLDNSGLFYDCPPADDYCLALEQEAAQALQNNYRRQARFKGCVRPYASKASPRVAAALAQAAAESGFEYCQGITASASGLFAAQGKEVGRIPATIPGIDRVLSQVRCGDELLMQNMEMESSFLFHFAGGHGHLAGSVCTAVDNPLSGVLDSNPEQSMRGVAEVALKALNLLQQSEGGC